MVESALQRPFEQDARLFETVPIRVEDGLAGECLGAHLGQAKRLGQVESGLESRSREVVLAIEHEKAAQLRSHLRHDLVRFLVSSVASAASRRATAAGG